MGGQDTGLSEAEQERSKALIEAIEARMRQAETLTWAVPGLAITGQAFLMTIALDGQRSDSVRAIAAGTGVLLLAAALHFLGKHVFNFDVFEAVIERERLKLGYDRITRSYLVADIESFPDDTLLRQREWCKDEKRARRFNRLYRPWARGRNLLIIKVKTVWVWGFALTALGVLDLAVLVWVLV